MSELFFVEAGRAATGLHSTAAMRATVQSGRDEARALADDVSIDYERWRDQLDPAARDEWARHERHAATIARANVDDTYFMALCAED